MTGSALFATAVLMFALALFLMGDCQFLIPYRALIVQEYGVPILFFIAALFMNLFSAVHLACRTLFLKDTGRKLAHLEKQLRTGGVSKELAGRREE